MMKNGLFCHGAMWSNNGHSFLGPLWDTNSEGVLVYKLFNVPFKPLDVRYDLPLFVYFYPLCFYNDCELEEHLHKAVDWQFDKYGHCGVTACHGPFGYQINDSSIISPVSLFGISRLSKKADSFLNKLPVHKTTVGYCVRNGWRSRDKYGIDYGSALLLLNRK
jgi:hypothetical protein